MELFNTIGNNIKTFREKLKMTQGELASFIGVSREVVSYYETGSRDIPIAILEKISTVFGVEVIDLMEENPESVNLKLAFAFRANQLSTEDFETIARFQRIVKNYEKMKKLLENEAK